MATAHGTGLRVDDGDLVFTDGRLAFTTDLANLRQALSLRVLTALGSDRYDTRYGLDTRAVFTGPEGAHGVADLLRLNLVRTLGSDPRVRKIRDIRVHQPDPATPRRWQVDVSIIAADGSALDLPLQLGAPS